MFTQNDIEKLSELVKVTVDETEKERLAGMLSQTAEYMDMLNELNTDHIEPTYQVTGLTNVFQTDNLNKTLTQEEVLSNSAHHSKDMIQTEGVFDRE